MKTTLIFSPEIFGHYCEYLHHIYERSSKLEDQTFVFAVPENFGEVAKNMTWEPRENISFLYFPVIRSLTSLKRVLMLRRLVKKTGATHIFLPSLMTTLPWLPFFVSSGVRVSGIVYLLYVYRHNCVSLSTKIADFFKYVVFSRFRVFDQIFLLNDKVVPRYLNKKFKTRKFEWIPDPIAILPRKRFDDLRNKWNVSNGTQIFSHLGVMTQRKGTLEILAAVCRYNPQNSLFVFAGEVREDIRDEFYRLVEYARARGANIMIFDRFCSYDFLINLSQTSDVILIPYKNTEQSSGIIAYAAATDTPVFCPRTGLLGKLVKRYQLGITFHDVSSEGISKAFTIDWKKIPVNGSGYLKDNALSVFQEKVFPKKY